MYVHINVLTRTTIRKGWHLGGADCRLTVAM